MNFPPMLRQLFVASAPPLAAVSVGGIVGFPGILFPQLKANESTIHLDVHSASWIGSTHGLAGLLACFMPLFMQYKGRKLTFILSCLIGLIGWILIYFAQDANTLIVAEMIHGLSLYCLLSSSMQTISEMVHPKLRIMAMITYFLGQTFGMNLILLFGRNFYWKTVSLIECCPIILALLISLTWPESPAWLAYKGEFDKCETAFKWLRGTDPDSDRELKELIRAYKEKMVRSKARNPFKLDKNSCNTLWLKIRRRDFYLPCLHTFILLMGLSWSGLTVIITYTMDMMQQATGSESAASIGVIVVYLILFFGNALGLFLLKFCKNKTILLGGGIGVIVFLIAACIFSYLIESNILPSDSLLCLYCLIGYAVSFNIGADLSILSVAAELMPIKHRGLGGAIYLLLISSLDFTTLKASPYLFLYIKPWGTFLLYSVNAMVCFFLIWRYVPETKKRTLQEIEEFYNNGKFIKRCEDDNVLENIKDSNIDD